MKKFAIFITCLYLLSPAVLIAKGVYQEPESFLKDAFAGKIPDAKIMWITRSIRPEVEEILGHKSPSLRLRYWKQQNRSAWILEEIGKEKPITVGIVVNDKRIERVKILIFRESRGWEIRHDFFTKQFTNASMSNNHQLDRHIDGISGATLSVRAVKKLARLALYLAQQAEQQ